MDDAGSGGKWLNFVNETYIKEAGWYFKTLAVQEIGEKKKLLTKRMKQIQITNHKCTQ